MSKALEMPDASYNPSRLANKALNALEEAAGGREQLMLALVHAEQTPEQEHLLALLADPRNDTTGLGRLCGMAELSVGKFLKMLKEGKHAKALMEAMDRVSALLPPVAEDLMLRAAPHLAPCASCTGQGKVMVDAEDPEEPLRTIEKTCLDCRGEGKIPVQPDLARQKVALEVGGLLKREPQVVVNNQQAGFFARFGADDRSSFRGKMDEVLNAKRQGPRADVVDAEPATAPAEDAQDASGGDGA